MPHRSAASAVRLVLLAVVAACATSPTALPPDFGARLGPGFGCGDVYFYAVDPSDRYLLEVVAEGLVAAAREAGAETTRAFTLPDAAVSVRVEVGLAVSDAACDDVIENDGPRVDAVYRGVSGSAVIRVRPDGTGEGARADLELEDVVLEPEAGGASVTLDAFTVTDVAVGWYPG